MSLAKLPAREWFEYPIRVQPHHTDYGGVVWHGSYITWLESARVECLRAAGVPFDQLIALGYDLPVVAMDLRYRYPLSLGMSAVVKTRLGQCSGIRIPWTYEIKTIEPEPQLCLAGTVTLVTVDTTHRRVVRRLPAEVKNILTSVQTYCGANLEKR